MRKKQSKKKNNNNELVSDTMIKYISTLTIICNV